MLTSVRQHLEVLHIFFQRSATIEWLLGFLLQRTQVFTEHFLRIRILVTKKIPSSNFIVFIIELFRDSCVNISVPCIFLSLSLSLSPHFKSARIYSGAHGATWLPKTYLQSLMWWMMSMWVLCTPLFVTRRGSEMIIRHTVTSTLKINWHRILSVPSSISYTDWLVKYLHQEEIQMQILQKIWGKVSKIFPQ